MIGDARGGPVVVGGGIAGLAAAWELARRGLRPLVLERASRPGGVIFTERVGDLTIDAGPDSVLVQKPAAIELCAELGLAGRLIPTLEPRTAYILRDGRLHPLPGTSVLGIPTSLGRLATHQLFSPAGRLRMALDLILPASRLRDDESIGAFIGRRFGREAVDYVAEPLLAGIHAGDVDRLSVRALFPRLVEAEAAHGSLIRAFRRARAGTPPAEAGFFRSLPGGMGELVDALVGALPAGTIRLDHEVTRLERGRRWRVHTASGEAIQASTVLLAVPAWSAAALTEPIDAGLADLCRQVRYQSTAIVVLAYPRDRVKHPLRGNGFVVPRREGRDGLLAVSFVSSKWAGRAPPGVALLRAFFGGARAPEMAGRDDAALLEAARGALGPLLGLDGLPLLGRVYRWMDASPQHEVGHLARLERLERRLSETPGLFVTGAGFRGVGIPDCVADGRATARRLAAYLNSGAAPA